MDRQLLRTFLEVHRMRSFSKAAENLCITPSAVSARIQQLEKGLGVSLFVRNSQEVRLTHAGERLLRHATGILQAMERAWEDVVLEERHRRRIAIAGIASFWDVLLQAWLNRVRGAEPELALRVEVSTAARIAEKLASHQIQLGFLYSPPQHAELILREVQAMSLVLVASRPGLEPETALGEGYVHVDWGTAFDSQHSRAFPHRPIAALRCNSGRIALELIRTGGGSAYLPRVMVASALASGQLFPVEAAPEFQMHIYAAYHARDEERETLERMLRHFD